MLKMFSDVPAFRRDPLKFVEAKGRSGEALQRLHLGPHPTYLVADPALARDVLRADEADIDKGRHKHKLIRVLGLNSVTLSGPEHRSRRGVILRTMNGGMASDYVPRLDAVVRAWLATLTDGDTINAHKATARLTLQAICTTLFGPDALSAEDEVLLIEAVRLVEDDLVAEMFRILPLTPWGSMQQRRKMQRSREMMTLVVDRMCRRATSMSLLKALQDLGLEGDALRDEVLIVLLAGHHTTGAAAAWLLYFLAANPALARDMAAEAERVVNTGAELTPVALRSAAQSRALASEVLRLYPSTYWTARDLKRDRELAGHRLREGTSLLISIWHLHRDPRFWPEPETLKLDRNWIANPAYMPFGFGARACSGMAVALLMLQLIALEVALTLDLSTTTAEPPGAPKPSVTLAPPEILLRVGVKNRAAQPAVAMAV